MQPRHERRVCLSGPRREFLGIDGFGTMLFSQRYGWMLAALAILLLGPRSHAGEPGPTHGDLVIEKYLAHQAATLSERVLGGARTLDEWQKRRPSLRQEFLEMLGLSPLPEKTALKATITGT